MRLPILSAALCGLAFIPRVVSQLQGSGSEGQGGQAPQHTTDAAQTSQPTNEAAQTSQPTNEAAQTSQPTNDAAQPTNNSSDKGKTNVGAIAGGVVGGIIVLALIGALAFFLVRRRRRARSSDTQGESVAVFDKSRASSPTSHAAISPIYSAGVPAVPSQPQLQTQPQPQAAAPPPPPAPGQPVAEPVELQSREVDDDGVSVNSFDMARPAEDRVVPRLPVYHRGTPPGGSAAAS